MKFFTKFRQTIRPAINPWISKDGWGSACVDISWRRWSIDFGVTLFTYKPKGCSKRHWYFKPIEFMLNNSENYFEFLVTLLNLHMYITYSKNEDNWYWVEIQPKEGSNE